MADFDNLLSASRSSSVLGAIANPATINPLAAASAAADTATRIYQAKAAQADNAWGNALQQATDPNTGQVDYGKAQAIASQDPTARQGMLKALGDTSVYTTQQLERNATQNKIANQTLAGVLKLPDDQLGQGVIEGTQRLMSMGLLRPDQAHNVLLSLNGSNPQVLRSQLEQMWRGTMSPEQQQTATYGNVGSQTGPGGNTIGTVQQTTGPNAGAVSVPEQQGAPQGLGARELDAPFVYKGPKGEEITTTLRQFYKDHGMAVPGAATGAAGLPSSLHNPAKAQPAPGPAPSGGQPAPSPNAPAPTPNVNQPGGPVVTSPAPAELDRQKQAATQSAQRFQGEADNDVQAQTQLSQLGNMQSSLAQFTSGSGADRTLDVKRAIQSWGPAALSKAFGITPESIASQEDFTKLANQISLAQQNAGSDSRMNISVAANPHAGLSPEGADLIIRQLQGNADYLRARAKLAANYGGDRTDYPGFQASIAKLDPRAFQLMRMTPEQQKTYFNSLNPKAQTELKQSWRDTQALIGGGGGG